MGYLLHLGYLSIKEEIRLNRYLLTIPNKEIKSAFENEIMNYFISDIKLGSLLVLKEAINSGESDKPIVLLEEILKSSFSFYDFNDERNYHIFVLTLSSLIYETNMVKSEVNTGLGRSDIMVYPNSKDGIAIIFEIKNHKSNISSKKLKELSEKALKQICEKDYNQELTKFNPKRIIAYGIAFHKRNVQISCKDIIL